MRTLSSCALVCWSITAVSIATSGCSVYDSSLIGSGGDGGVNPTSCEHATWPAPPTRSDPGDEQVDVVGALTFFDLGEQYTGADGTPVPARTQGYDLDNTCTSNPELQDPLLDQGSSCVTPGWIENPTIGDLHGGRDNALRYVVGNIAKVYSGFGTVPYNENIRNGRVSLMLGIKDYNGQLNDTAVSLTIYPTRSFTEGGANGGEGSRAVPKFDGTDTWPIASDAFIDGDSSRPRLVSSGAYVKDGVLVGTFNDIDFRLSIGVSSIALVDLRVQFRSTFITAKILKDDRGLWALKKGQISARWIADELLSEVKYFENPLGDTRSMCMNAGTYAVPHNFICAAADISSGGVSPSAPCSAISVGIGFEGIQAKLGNVFTLPERQNPCEDRFDPVHDSCSHPFVKPGAADGG